MILSLVRNSDGQEVNAKRLGIGFLKVPNHFPCYLSLLNPFQTSPRIEPTVCHIVASEKEHLPRPPLVALSRAREGLYIMGNCSILSQNSKFWKEVLGELQDHGCVGTGIPVVCQRHPGAVRYISEPGLLSRIAPLGMHTVPEFDINGSAILFIRWLFRTVRNQVELRTCLSI